MPDCQCNLSPTAIESTTETVFRTTLPSKPKSMPPSKKGRGGYHSNPGDRGGPNGPAGHTRGRAALRQQQNQHQTVPELKRSNNSNSKKRPGHAQSNLETHQQDRIHKPAKNSTVNPVQRTPQPFGAGAITASTYSTRQSWRNNLILVSNTNRRASHRPSFNTCLSARTRVSKCASLCERCTRQNRQLRDELLDLLKRNSRAISKWMDAAGVSPDHMDFERTRARTIHDEMPPGNGPWTQAAGGFGGVVFGEQQRLQANPLFSDPFSGPQGLAAGFQQGDWSAVAGSPFGSYTGAGCTEEYRHDRQAGLQLPPTHSYPQNYAQPFQSYDNGMMNYRPRESFMSTDTHPPGYSLPNTPPNSGKGPWHTRMSVESLLNKDMGVSGHGLGVIVEDVSECAIS